MNFEKYTDRAKGFLQSAQGYALREGHQQFLPIHILKVFIDDSEGMAARLFKDSGGDAVYVKELTERELSKLPKVSGGSGQLYMPAETARFFEAAEQASKKVGDSFVTVEMMLVALATQIDSSAGKVLKEAGINAQSLNSAINAMRKGRAAHSSSAENAYEALKKYTRNLTEEAEKGKLDPVIGRDEEIRRTMQVLARRTKNNPIIIGEPGVGKTAIVEGLAQRIVSQDVPETLRDKQLLVLDLGSLVAGAKFRGEFEERLKAVLSEITAASGEIIVFIDEIHTLVGAGAAEGSMDASNLLKPALARGELHCIGATTLDEYRKYIEKDAALARRFQPVFVGEPSVSDTISILRGLKEKYELHHGVRITDGAIVAAATLANRYITDRFMPDKAIDLVDEAASRIRMEVDSKPEELDELDRKIIQLKIEREALKKESDDASKERLKNLEKELASLEEESRDLTSRWQSEKDKLSGVQKLKESLENARKDLEIAQRNGDLAKAGELAYGIIPELERKLQSGNELEENSLIKEEVTDEDIASVVSRWTGIPVERMMASERDKLLKMEDILKQKVVGQEDAVIAVSNAVRRSRAGLQDEAKPIGSFLFLGPTGVGKTELTKALAGFIFDDESALLRVDMSEYMEKHAVARLIGAPPGYVGYEEGGVITEAVRRRPYQVILFDEVEKAHPDVFNILLQVLDEGRLTDGQGRTVDFRNTIIILTSNLGSDVIANSAEDTEMSLIRDKVMNVVRASFRPEFLNRLDDIILFRRLSRKDMGEIVKIQLARLIKKLEERRISVNITDSALQWLADAGYDPIYGARPLKRVIQRELQNVLAEKILSGEIKDSSSINIIENGGVLNIAI